jgi:hypothetical protein
MCPGKWKKVSTRHDLCTNFCKGTMTRTGHKLTVTNLNCKVLRLLCTRSGQTLCSRCLSLPLTVHFTFMNSLTVRATCKSLRLANIYSEESKVKVCLFVCLFATGLVSRQLLQPMVAEVCVVQGRRITSHCKEVKQISSGKPLVFLCIIHQETAECFTGDKRSYKRCDLKNGLHFTQQFKPPSVPTCSIISRIRI